MSISRAIRAFLVVVAGMFAQTQPVRHAIPLDKVEFRGGATNCHTTALETGNPTTGPATLILKAVPGCVVPWHSHTAEEQFMVAVGTFLTEMEGETPARLDAGGFAVMPGGHKHQFSCRSSVPCVGFVAFNQKYDIAWVDKKNSYIDTAAQQ